MNNMKLRDKVFIVGLALAIIAFAVFVLTDTPIQKATKEYIKNGDILYYEYK